MELGQFIAILIFLTVIASPAWFFQKLEKILHEDYTGDDTMAVDTYVSPQNIIPQFDTKEALARDEKILNNLNVMIKKSRKRRAKNMWKLKKIEYLRELRWKKHLTV